MQVTRFDPQNVSILTFVENAADASIKGIEGDIIEINDGKSVLSTVERISQKFGRSSQFIILMDWDKTGNKLAKQLISYGEACDLIPNDKIRVSLSKFTAKEISCVEELPTFVFGLGHKDLFL